MKLWNYENLKLPKSRNCEYKKNSKFLEKKMFFGHFMANFRFLANWAKSQNPAKTPTVRTIAQQILQILKLFLLIYILILIPLPIKKGISHLHVKIKKKKCGVTRCPPPPVLGVTSKPPVLRGLNIFVLWICIMADNGVKCFKLVLLLPFLKQNCIREIIKKK